MSYDQLHNQVTTLMAALGAVIDQHAKRGREYPDDLLRLRERLINALQELSSMSLDEIEELIGA